MIGLLVRQNPAIRTLPRWFAISVLTATFVLNVMTFTLLKYKTSFVDSYMPIIWIALAIYLVFADTGTRCGPFQISLPVPSRTWWLANLIAVFVAATIIVVGSLVLIQTGTWLLWKLTDKWVLTGGAAASLLAYLIAGVVLGTALLQSRDPATHKIVRRRGSLLYGLVIVIAVGVAIIGLNRLSPFAFILPLALAVPIIVRSYRRVPVAYSLAPARAGVGPGLVSVGQDELSKPVPGQTRFGSWRLLVGTIYRSYLTATKRKHSMWITFPFLVGFGFLFSGVDQAWWDVNLRFAYISMGAYLLLAFTAPLLNSLHIIDPLPVSRRLLLAVLIFPHLLLLMAGYGLGRTAVWWTEVRDRPELIEFSTIADDRICCVDVPARFCRITRGEPPRIEAPWGESAEAWHRPLHKGSDLSLFSPFSVSRTNSPEFVALQITRAVEAVYGDTIPPDEIMGRYIEVDEDGAARIQSEGLTLRQDYPDLRPVGQGPVFPVIVLLVSLLWFLLLWVFFHAFRSSISHRKRQLVFWLLMLLAFSLWLGQLVGAMTEFMEPSIAAAFFEVFIGTVADGPLGSLLVYGTCSVVFAGGYWILQRRFERIEAVETKTCV